MLRSMGDERGSVLLIRAKIVYLSISLCVKKTLIYLTRGEKQLSMNKSHKRGHSFSITYVLIISQYIPCKN